MDVNPRAVSFAGIFREEKGMSREGREEREGNGFGFRRGLRGLRATLKGPTIRRLTDLLPTKP